MSRIGVLGGAYLALQIANVQAFESLAGLVAVADILESLGGILAGNIEQNLLTTTGTRKKTRSAIGYFSRIRIPIPPSSLRGARKRRGIAVDAGRKGRQNVRVLVDELAAVVDLVVDHDEDVLLGVVLSNILVGVLLRHDGRVGSKVLFFLFLVLGER